MSIVDETRNCETCSNWARMWGDEGICSACDARGPMWIEDARCGACLYTKASHYCAAWCPKE